MAVELGNEGAQAVIEAVLAVNVKETIGATVARDSIGTLIYELETDWFRGVCDDPFAYALREAAYSLAADSLLAHYVLWPLAARRADPYAPALELWRHGRVLRWSEGSVDVHFSNGVKRA
jgi:hypothetical protein